MGGYRLFETLKEARLRIVFLIAGSKKYKLNCKVVGDTLYYAVVESGLK